MKIRRSKVISAFDWFSFSFGIEPFTKGVQIKLVLFHRGFALTFMTDKQFEDYGTKVLEWRRKSEERSRT